MKRAALITGASSGIGMELAKVIAAGGQDVVLVARTAERLEELACSLEKSFGIKARVLPEDLNDPAAARRIFEQLQSDGWELSTLVNNAGLGLTGPFAETDLAVELRSIQVNIIALTQLTKLFLPAMIARREGQVLNVASTASFQPGPLMAVYYATKAYVLSFSEAIAEELRDSGVTVTALCPGPTETGFAHAAGVDNSRLFKLVRPMHADEVARIGYRAMRRGHRVVVAGLRNSLMAQSVRFSPRRAVTMIVRKLQERRQ